MRQRGLASGSQRAHVRVVSGKRGPKAGNMGDGNMTKTRSGLARVLAVAMFAASTVACGDIEFPLTLATEGENFIDIAVPAGSPNPVTTELVGGVEATLFTEINFIHILFGQPIMGVLEFDDLLFAGTPFSLLGANTEEVCIVPDGAGGGGTVEIDLLAKQATFVASLETAVEVGNPALGGLLPGGLPFAIAVESTTDFTLLDLIGLVGGSGGFTLSQEIMEQIIVPTPFGNVPADINGVFTLTTANEFPVDPLLDDCIAFLGL